MKIKKLTLQGFKSFAERLEILFPMGISGVVGPNGCGKSNIVDAIRWCLGEQSPKQLRGRRMEDVIFSGAGNYKALGMAEVSLVLENGDGSFPQTFSEYPEISLTRRLYRSGESEYLINNVPCRLKDIQEIFMDTGLGNRAYSIIGQGQIGQILEQKPEETRVMLEEAAGVTKYKKKVEASKRKIELTETNLQRVEDILGETEKQMRSLKRQAAKARRYKAIGQEIQDLELVLQSNIYSRLEQDSGTKKASVDELTNEEIALSAELSRYRARVEDMNLALEKKDAELAERRKAFFELKERVNKKESSMESLAGEIRMLEELEGRLRGEQEEINARLLTLKEEQKQLEEKIAQIASDVSDMQGEISLREKRQKAKRDFLKGIKEEYEKARVEFNDGVNKEVGLNHESGYINKVIKQITDSRSRIEKEQSEINGKIESLREASERKGRTREAIAKRLEEINADIDNKDMEYQELKESRAGIENELKAAEAEQNMLQSRLSSLQALTENFEGYKKGVRSIMKADDFGPRKEGRVLGLMADFIQVKSGYEQAVEAVLADKLQYVIVEGIEDGRQAVDYLKEKAKGRSSFVPLKEASGNGNRAGDAEGFPMLTDFVSAEEGYGHLVNALLGDVVLVQTLDDAVSKWREKNAPLCFVTRDGDMLDQRGVISGGKLSQNSHGPLTRKRQISELEEKTAAASGQVDALTRKRDAVEKEALDKEQALEYLKEEKANCRDELNQCDNKLYRLGQELDQLRRYSTKLSEDLERTGTEHNRQKEELSRIEEELRQRKARRQKEEFYFQEKETELRESEEEFEAAREELSQLQADCRILLEEQRGLGREKSSKEEYTQESLKRIEKIEEEVARGRERLDECRMKNESIEDEIEGYYETLKEAEEKVNRAEQERREYYGAIREEERKEEHCRGKLEDQKELISRARMEQSEISIKMEGLVQNVKEKFGLDLPHIYQEHLRPDDFSQAEYEENLAHKKRLREKMGEVNLIAIKEHEALKERHDFIKGQREDLLASIESLRSAIRKINRTSLEKFRQAFTQVDEKLKEIFPILFSGGTAGLRLTDEDRPLESGVLVEVQPPGKKLSHMGLLSGGEKALVAMALLFSIYMIKPSPFCLLDEVDAPLDEANIDRFNKLLEEIKRNSQIIMVTHSRRTMEITDRLYGVTMETAGISKTVSVDIEGAKKHAATSPGESNTTPMQGHLN